MNKKIKAIKKKISSLVMALTLSVAYAQAASADGLGTSTLVTGTKKLIADATAVIIGLSVVIGVLIIIYFLVRRAGADQQDKVQWEKRIKIAITSVIGAAVTTSIVGIILSYYNS